MKENEIDLEFHFKNTKRGQKNMGIIEELKGKRTYIMAASLAIWGILGLLLGKNEIQEAITIMLEASALAGIRASVAKP